MKKKSSTLVTVVCILIALLIVGWLNGRNNAQTTPTPSFSDEPAQLAILPQQETPNAATPTPDDALEPEIDEDGKYDSKEDVALYIHTFGRLPSNYVTKETARKAGWEGGSLEKYFPGCSIGGDVFGNMEGLLPKKRSRTYYECDIDTAGKKARGAKRIVFSDDGLIYYTDDHFESFVLLYGEVEE